MDGRDAIFASSSLAAILILVLAAVLIAAFLFTFGSPLLLIGLIAGAGALGLAALAGALIAFISLWYIAYALLREAFPENRPAAEKGDYTLGRIKKA